MDKITDRDHLWHKNIPDSKVNGANMGPIWGRQDPGGSHVGPMNLAIRDRFTNLNIQVMFS